MLLCNVYVRRANNSVHNERIAAVRKAGSRNKREVRIFALVPWLNGVHLIFLLLSWCKQCLPNRSKHDLVRPELVRIRKSTVLRATAVHYMIAPLPPNRSTYAPGDGENNLIHNRRVALTCKAACSAFDPPRPTHRHSDLQSQRSIQGRCRPEPRRQPAVAAFFVAGARAQNRRTHPPKPTTKSVVCMKSIALCEVTPSGFQRQNISGQKKRKFVAYLSAKTDAQRQSHASRSVKHADSFWIPKEKNVGEI